MYNPNDYRYSSRMTANDYDRMIAAEAAELAYERERDAEERELAEREAERLDCLAIDAAEDAAAAEIELGRAA